MWLRVLVQNDLAVLAAMEGRFDEACQGWRAAIESGRDCLPARLNLGLVEAELSMSAPTADVPPLGIAPPREEDQSVAREKPESGTGNSIPRRSGPIRVAVLSLLFNWPSTGGGNMHTAGLVEFLGRAGYDVRHFYACYPAWGIGRVADEEPLASEGIEFDDGDWNLGTIRQRFRSAVDSFAPDYVVISDAWNMKPHLAEAMRGYPYLMLVQAQECLCPLNNLRLLGVGPNQVEQCPRNQLATPQVCHQCLAERGYHAGALHQHERALAGVGTAEYDRILRKSFYEAEAVLVLNPITAAMVEPYARRVCVVPWGIDAGRFPVPPNPKSEIRNPKESPAPDPANSRPIRLFMAAVAGEVIKGFHVAHEACRLLRENRADFELVVTFDPPGQIDEFTRSVGWCSQAELPGHYRAADICLVPTIAQDALSITSVEAMAAGIPVVASRIGGLPYTVTDGVTGLLCEPGNPADQAGKIGKLLDDPDLRRQMGLAGRKRFEEDFTWEAVIDRYWRPLLVERVRR